MQHTYTYLIDTINQPACTVTVVYKHTDPSFNAHVAVISFDPATQGTPVGMDALIKAHAPIYKWDAELKNMEKDLSALESILTNEFTQPITAPAVTAPTVSLVEYKKQKCSMTNSYRDTANAEPIEYNGRSFDADFKARNNYYMALSYSGEWPEGMTWRTFDNVDVPATKALIQGIVDALAERDSTYHALCVEIKSQIMAAGTIAAIDAIVLDQFGE